MKLNQFYDHLMSLEDVEEIREFFSGLVFELRTKKNRVLARNVVEVARRIASPVYISPLLNITEPRNLFTVVDPGKSTMVLAARWLAAVSKPTVNRTIEALQMLVEYLDALREPVIQSPTPNRLEEILVQTEEQIGVLPLVSKRHPLVVLSINKSCAESNSWYHPAINTIVMLSPKQDHGDPEYIFLHELGHAVQVNITEDIDRIPDSFRLVFMVCFGSDPATIESKRLCEVFADAFTVAVSYETDLAASNPFCQLFFPVDQAGLQTYFRMLIQMGSHGQDMVWGKQQLQAFKKAISMKSPGLNRTQLLKRAISRGYA